MPKKLKIGFVLDDGLDSTDGVQQYILTLGEWLSGHGHEIHYLVGHTTRKDIDNIHSLSRTIRVSANQNKVGTPLPAKQKTIKKLLDKEKFDVLHVQMPYSPLLAGKIISNAPKHTVIIGTFHILPSSKIEHFATKLLGKSLKKSLKKFDKIISVSEPAANFAKSTFGVASEVIPNAVDISKFETPGHQKIKNEKKVKIVYLGRLVKRKGCIYLLTALMLLKDRGSLKNVEVIIASKGPLEKKLKKLSIRYDLQENVRFVGFVPEDEKPGLLASADIAVMPSVGGESFGIVLVEAMAAGADVVIAGNNPGYKSVMSSLPEQLVEPTNTVGFAETLEKYIKNKNLREKSYQKQQKLVNKFDVSTVGNELLRAYRKHLK